MDVAADSSKMRASQDCARVATATRRVRDEMRRLTLSEEVVFHFPFAPPRRVICHFRDSRGKVRVKPDKSETAQMISFNDKYQMIYGKWSGLR
jgi:hypothetical protein